MNKSNKVHPASLLLINFLQFSIIFGSTALTEVCKEEGAKLYHEFGNRVTCSYYLDPLDTTSIVEKTKYWDGNKTKIMSIIKYSNGGKQFSYNRFNQFGILDISATYKNGLLEGKLTSFYSNGKKEYNQMYKNGIKNGIYTKYYKNGRMAIRGSYKNHQRIGRWIEYYNDGVVKNKTKYLNESNGANLNPSVSYNQDGTVKRTVKKLKNGDIESISYSRSGNAQYLTLYRGRLAYEKYEYDQFSGLLTDSFVRDLESGLVNYKKYY